MAPGKKIRRSSAVAEARSVKAVEEVASGRALERLMEKLEEGGDVLVNRVLNFLECQAAEHDILDLQAPFRRNLAKFGDLTLKDLRPLFAAMHGALWAEQIIKRVRLQSARSLLCYAVNVDYKDFFARQDPRRTSRHLGRRLRAARP